MNFASFGLSPGLRLLALVGRYDRVVVGDGVLPPQALTLHARRTRPEPPPCRTPTRAAPPCCRAARARTAGSRKATNGLPSSRAISCSAAARPISTMGVRMLVSGRRLRGAEVGVVDAGDRDVLRDAHAGLRGRPSCAPTANTSLVATTAVGGAARARAAVHHRRRPRRGSIGPYCDAGARRAPARPAASAARMPAPRSRRAVVAVGDGAEQAEAAMAERRSGGASSRRSPHGCRSRCWDAGASDRRPRSARRAGRSRRAARTAPGRGRGRRRRSASTPLLDQLLGHAQFGARGRSDARPAPANSRLLSSTRLHARWWCARTARSRTTGTTAPIMRLRWLRSARAAPCGT